MTIGSFSNGGAILFGVRGRGTRIAFLVDRSSSMGWPTSGEEYRNTGSHTRFQLACRELIRSVNQFEDQQFFSVVLFNDSFSIESRFVGCQATSDNKRALADWIQSIYPNGGTNPVPGAEFILSEKIDTLYIISDGEFEPMAVGQIRELNRGRVIIHTIALDVDAHTMRELANQNRGQYRYVR